MKWRSESRSGGRSAMRRPTATPRSVDMPLNRQGLRQPVAEVAEGAVAYGVNLICTGCGDVPAGGSSIRRSSEVDCAATDERPMSPVEATAE
jgi:hypothetical protein